MGNNIPAIKVENLSKSFGFTTAVNNISFEIEKGKIYGFLGPNGAGKTTTIKMLTGALSPEKGKIEILGMPLFDSSKFFFKKQYSKNGIKIKRLIGVIPEEPDIYQNLTGHEFLKFIIEIYNINYKEIKNTLDELIKAFNVDFLYKFVSDMSHGMKQKLLLISVLMRTPEIIFLDEPTVGLDAKSVKILKLLLKKISEQGKTVFLTTHILEIAEKLCDEIIIINKGQIIAKGNIKKIKSLKEDSDTSQNLEDLFLQLTGQDKEIEKIVEELNKTL
jgi:ABC-2 type transport system ATP-binding protein